MKHLILKIFNVIFIFKFASAFFGLTRFSNTHQEPQFQSQKCCKRFLIPIEKWIDQRLDNFNPLDDRKWKMRYYEDMSLLQPQGPIFIYLGGEWTISSRSIQEGTLIYEMAQETGGALFYTEHRYYGKSHPTQNTTTDNLKYLSVDQALADVAHFINFIKSSIPDLQHSKVIVVGASYSGTMAAWMRAKYPHLVSGSFASSGPIFAKLDFYEYKEVMSRSIERVGGDECREIISNAFVEMEQIVEQENTTRITEAFNLCENLDIPIDIPHFFYEVSDIVAGLVQSHRKGNIEQACDIMKEARQTKDDIEAFAEWVRNEDALVSKGIIDQSIEFQDCLDFSYKNSISKFSNVEWDSLANQQMRQWIYQTCSQFAWFQTSTSDNQFFGSTYGLDYFIRICNDLYDKNFSKKSINQNVQRTNTLYGGFNPDLIRVVFTNGDLDPWHPMSVLEDLNESATAIVIPYSAHVSDLGAISNDDSNEMRAAKMRVKELILEWIGVSNIK